MNKYFDCNSEILSDTIELLGDLDISDINIEYGNQSIITIDINSDVFGCSELRIFTMDEFTNAILYIKKLQCKSYLSISMTITYDSTEFISQLKTHYSKYSIRLEPLYLSGKNDFPMQLPIMLVDDETLEKHTFLRSDIIDRRHGEYLIQYNQYSNDLLRLSNSDLFYSITIPMYTAIIVICCLTVREGYLSCIKLEVS